MHGSSYGASGPDPWSLGPTGWLQYLRRVRLVLSRREFVGIGMVVSIGFVGAGSLLMAAIPEPETRHLRKPSSTQRQWQQERISSMIREANERNSSENITAAIDAMGKFYGFTDSMAGKPSK